MKKLIAALLGLVLATSASFGKEPLKIGWSDWPGWVAWEIAKEKGYFKKRGVEVDLRWFPNYVDSLTALNTGQLDANCQTWNDTILPLAEGIKLKAVLVNDNSDGNDGLMAAPGISSVKELKGKTVVTEEGTVDHFVLLQALSRNGMSVNDITFKNMLVPDAAAAFVAGKVDAAVIWQPWLHKTQADGKGKLLFSSKEMPGLIPDMLVFQAKVVDERADDIQKVVAVWFDVVAFIRSNENEAVKLMAKVVEQKPADYAVFLPGTKFFDLEANVKAFTKSDQPISLYASGQEIAEFYKGLGMIKELPDYKAAIEGKFIKALSK